MAITASGLYGLTLEKFLLDTAGESLEAADLQGLLVTDTETPAFDTDDFVDDVSANELGDGDYARDTVASPAVTLATGTLKFDATDGDFGASVTLTNAMAHIIATEAGTDAQDQLVVLQDFVTAASSTSGQFTVQHHTNGIFTIDYTP